MPAAELAAARSEIAKLQRVMGKKTLENEILKESVAYATEEGGLRAAVGRHLTGGSFVPTPEVNLQPNKKRRPLGEPLIIKI